MLNIVLRQYHVRPLLLRHLVEEAVRTHCTICTYILYNAVRAYRLQSEEEADFGEETDFRPICILIESGMRMRRRLRLP